MALIRDANTELRGVNLQPAASTPDTTYVRPATPERTSPVGDFLQALGKLAPAVNDYATVQFNKADDPVAKRDQQATAMLKAARANANGGSEAVKKLSEDGSLNPVQKRVYAGEYGKAKGYEALNAINAKIGGQDLTNVDVGALVREEYNKHPELENDPAAAAGWNSIMGNAQQQLTELRQKAQVGTQIAQRNDVSQATTTGGFFAAVAQGGDNAGLKFLNEKFSQDKDWLAMPPEQQKKQLFDLAKQAAETGNKPALEQLGKYERFGQPMSKIMGSAYENYMLQADNVQKRGNYDQVAPVLQELNDKAAMGTLQEDDPDLMKVREWGLNKFGGVTATAYQSYLNKNEATLREQRKSLVEGQRLNAKSYFMTEAKPQLDGLIQNGTINSIKDRTFHYPLADGKSVEISGKDVVQQTLQNTADDIDRLTRRQMQGRPEAAVTNAIRDKQTQMYANQGELDPYVKSTVGAFLTRTPVDNHPSPADIIGARELLRLKRLSPTQADEIVKSDKDKAMLGAMVVAQNAGLTEEQIVSEGRAARDNYGKTLPAPKATVDSVKDKVKANFYEGGKWYLAGGGGQAVDNVGYLDKLVEDGLRTYQRAGITDPDKLNALVTNDIKASHTTFGGYVTDVRGLGLSNPAQANPVFEDAVKKLQAANPKYAGHNITFVRDGDSDRFHAFDDHGAPVPMKSGDAVTWAQMLKGYNESKVVDDAKAKEDAAAKGVKTAEMELLTRPDPDLSPEQLKKKHEIMKLRGIGDLADPFGSYAPRPSILGGGSKPKH